MAKIMSREEMQELTLKHTIIENRRWFNVYSYLPLIVAIVIMSISFIAGIVLSAIMPTTGSAVLALFLSWLVGGIMSTVTFLLLKIVFSYKILHIAYLTKLIRLVRNNEKEATK